MPIVSLKLENKIPKLRSNSNNQTKHNKICKFKLRKLKLSKVSSKKTQTRQSIHRLNLVLKKLKSQLTFASRKIYTIAMQRLRATFKFSPECDQFSKVRSILLLSVKSLHMCRTQSNQSLVRQKTVAPMLLNQLLKLLEQQFIIKQTMISHWKLNRL